MHTEAFLRFYTAFVENQSQTQREARVEPTTDDPAPVFRVDKFIVPAAALSRFTEKMRHIQRTLRALPGCRRALTLSQTGGTGEFNVVTLVEWANAEAVSAATATMQSQFAKEGFDPPSFAQQLGVRGDFGFYRIR